MTRIDADLLKRRAEHNEGILADLKEVTLHQFEIEKIENLHLCRQLEIVYLQNNKISKIEGLNKLKALQYLNLAVNLITKIENLEACESLRKLDLTANNIIDIRTVQCLENLEFLSELYLVGNPCCYIEGYRHYVIHTLPQLKTLDGSDIEISERIEARQLYSSICESLPRLVEKAIAEAPPPVQEPPKEEEKAKRKEEDEAGPSIDIFRPDGTVLQKNEGGWNFKMKEDEENVILTVPCGKYLDTSLIQVDAHPKYIIITIKGKVLRLNFPAEVTPSACKAQRATITGDLTLTLPKCRV
ncbi:hypothetical protein PROFUN_05684 [Planoprotostelium fungivorum]|uniref:U2A'/phosphoprotein 32 family A C-terminal domain-containing protein n=1 Tax=Planoprotostelium fungivorum TaxID=1890364 RepID=A0A2P6NQI3_9EUKA|nr:hypothetical protein PROFUN_05684 [Planoprotostelium fungivorum]